MDNGQLTNVSEKPSATQSREMIVYSHSQLLYFWPIWAVGYVMALVTYLQGNTMPFADSEVVMHPSKNLGVIYTMVFFLVILFTNITVRGLLSVVVLMAGVALTFMFAFLGWWDNIFSAISSLAIHMNLGFYVFFSTALLIVWLLAVFVFDRLDHYRFRPGQMIHVRFWGGGEQTYDAHGMSVNKMRDDFFRHWILGLGSGDLQIATTGAKKQEFILPNVLFIGPKVDRIQTLTAMKPDEAADMVEVTETVGEPS